MEMANSRRFETWILSLGLLLVLLFTASGFAQVPAENDAAIQASVVNALQQAPQLQGQQITAATIQGAVTLSGVVQNEADKQLAGKIASSVSGVHSVQNNLTIGNLSAEADTQAGEPSQGGENEQPQLDQNDNAQDQQPAAPSQPEAPAPPPNPPDTSQQGGYGTPPRPAYTPQQGGYGPPPQSSNAYPPPPPAERKAQNASGPVTVPAGTLLRVRTSEPLDTKTLQAGASFEVTAANDIFENGVIAIPRGAVLDGQVVESKNAGQFGGSARLQLRLTTLNLEGRVYPLACEVWSNQGPSKSGYTATNTAGAAILGALVGGVLGGGSGAAVGAVAGGVTGAAASAASSGPRVVLPPETLLAFHLAAPVTVQPVSYQEAERLAASAPQPPPQPRLRVRPMPPPPYYYYGPPAYYMYRYYRY